MFGEQNKKRIKYDQFYADKLLRYLETCLNADTTDSTNSKMNTLLSIFTLLDSLTISESFTCKFNTV